LPVVDEDSGYCMSSKEAIVIRHVYFEGLGSFESVLEDHDVVIRYVEAGIDHITSIDPETADLLIVLGGPIGACEDDNYPFLKHELGLLRQRLAAGRPTLGICLGAQMIARALGARVYPAPRKEIGWSRLILTDAGRKSPLRHLETPVLHWHGDTFDLPEGATALASTETCVNQAFSIGSNLLALQFHPEVRLPERMAYPFPCYDATRYAMRQPFKGKGLSVCQNGFT
jgi:GMP synthase (glutamine-hydrolysing)